MLGGTSVPSDTPRSGGLTRRLLLLGTYPRLGLGPALGRVLLESHPPEGAWVFALAQWGKVGPHKTPSGPLCRRRTPSRGRAPSEVRVQGRPSRRSASQGPARPSPFRRREGRRAGASARASPAARARACRGVRGGVSRRAGAGLARASSDWTARPAAAVLPTSRALRARERVSAPAPRWPNPARGLGDPVHPRAGLPSRGVRRRRAGGGGSGGDPTLLRRGQRARRSP